MRSITIYTKQIKLEEVALEEFEHMEDFWSKRRRKNTLGILSKVTRPIIAGNYQDLLYSIRHHNRASMIGVNLHGTWLKTYAREMSDEQIKRFAEIAKNDRCKRNYLEVKFQEFPGDMTSIIGFREWKDRVIGYEITVVHSHTYMFDVEAKTEGYTYNNGLWVPDGWAGKSIDDEFPVSTFAERVQL